MSIHRSYFNKNNTIAYNSYANTGRNPVTDIFFGSDTNTVSLNGFSRFIFNIDLSQLIDKVNSNVINITCTTGITHTLNMTNTIKFNEDLLNTFNSDARKRASSFDLILFRIPKYSGSTGDSQTWDEGVGYDFTNNIKTTDTAGALFYTQPFTDNTYSTRPSNWYENINMSGWSVPGLYSNRNNSTLVNYNDLVIIDIQHFEKGDEDINFNMTSEINGILDGTITDVTGWGIAYRPEFELITGLTSNYSVSFFTRHTQTFYEPYLLTTYDDLIQDDRNLFVEFIQNKLYLLAYVDGDLVSLDTTPTVDVLDPSGIPIFGYTDLTTCQTTKGVYEVIIPALSGYSTPCEFTDVWKNISYNSISLPNIENNFTLYSYTKKINIGPDSKEPQIYGFDYYGINQDEKILNTEIRKVGVLLKKAYTSHNLLQNVNAQYRVYVREGTTEVQIQDWTKINRTANEYYFIFDTRDKIPNEYFIDIKVNTSGETNIYKRTLKFQIVNKK